MGDRAATDRGDDLRNASRDGGPLPPVAPRPARSLLVDRPRGSRARCAASLEGAIPQRAVLPDPGGALLRNLVLHRPPLLPRLARSGRDGGSRGVGPPAPPRRARHHRPRADPDLRLDRLDHVAHAALVLDHVRRLFLRGFLRRVHRASLGRRGGDAPGGAARHGHQRRAPARYRKVPVRIHGVLGLHRLLPVLPHVVREPPGGDDLVQGADRGVLDDGLALPHGGTFRGSVLLPDGADRQAEGSDPGRRGSVAPRHALRGSLLAGHADAPSRGAPSVGCWTWPRSSPSAGASWRRRAG